jgi:hypothetical protein
LNAASTAAAAALSNSLFRLMQWVSFLVEMKGLSQVACLRVVGNIPTCKGV